MATVEDPVLPQSIMENCVPTIDQNEENITELQEDWGDEFNDVVTFLCGLHLNEYVEMFVAQGINLDIFLNLNEEDLCHIGMTNSKDRVTLLQGIKQLKQNRMKMNSEVELSNLSPEEVNSILANTMKHLTVIHASLAHMRLTLSNSQVHNSLINLTLSSAELIEILALKADVQAQFVTNQVNALLSKKPLVANQTSKSRWKLSLLMLSSVGVVCALLFYKKLQIN